MAILTCYTQYNYATHTACHRWRREQGCYSLLKEKNRFSKNSTKTTWKLLDFLIKIQDAA